MLQKIVSDTLEFYFSKMKKPRIEDISSMPEEILQKKGCAFVTLYLDGEVHGSAGNIKEIENSLGEEIISSTIDALSSDKRFPPLTLQQFEKIRFRVDIIEKREMLMFGDIKNIDPTKQGIIAIQRTYDTLGVILPNMHAKILSGEHLVEPLKQKMGLKKVDDSNCIFYKIETLTERNY